MQIVVRGPGSSRSGWPELPPSFMVAVGEVRSVYVLCDFVFTNHRTDRKERIVGCELHLKKRHLLFWKKTIFKAPVTRYSTRDDRTPFGQFELEPLSGPTALTVMVSSDMPHEIVGRLPRRFDMVAVFQLVGPVKSTERIIQVFTHDPKTRVSDMVTHRPGGASMSVSLKRYWFSRLFCRHSTDVEALKTALLGAAIPASWTDDGKPCWCADHDADTPHDEPVCQAARRALGLVEP